MARNDPALAKRYPHVWSPFLLCRYCKTTPKDAQRIQPESGGVGPCPLYPTLKLEDR